MRVHIPKVLLNPTEWWGKVRFIMADKSWGQAEHVLGMVGGLNYEELRARVDSGILGDVLSEKVLVERFSDPAVRCAIRTSLGLESGVAVAERMVLVPPAPQIYPVTFVPGLTWKERIQRTGCSIDSEIWQYVGQFPTIEDEDPVPIDVVLHHFGVAISSSDAEAGLAQAELDQISPARYLHLLEQQPELQRKFPLIHLRECPKTL